MKKLIAGMLSAFLMATGLIAFSSASALAACPYQGCLDTQPSGEETVSDTGKVEIVVTVDVIGSNKKPVGEVTVNVKKKGTAKIFYAKTKTLSRGMVTFTTQALKNGKYRYSMEYTKAKDSGFRNSVSTGAFTVK